jgi:hypothetical protein
MMQGQRKRNGAVRTVGAAYYNHGNIAFPAEFQYSNFEVEMFLSAYLHGTSLVDCIERTYLIADQVLSRGAHGFTAALAIRTRNGNLCQRTGLGVTGVELWYRTAIGELTSIPRNDFNA